MTSPLQDGHFPPDSSDRSATGPLESVSHYSYDSKDVAQHVQERFGRKFNSLNDAYLFPTDETEWSRLDKLHSQFLIAWSGLYPCPDMVEAVLEPAGQESKKILDVGCGTGKWPLEMALKFPHCGVNGIDLSPSPINIASYPPNLHLDVLDVNKGLKHLYRQFDFVHARCTLAGISNPRKTFEEMQRCLKPGGLLILIDGDINALDVAFHKVKMAKVRR